MSNDKKLAESSALIDIGVMSADSVNIATGSAVIVTNDDKLRIVVMEHLENLSGRDTWGVPLGIVLTILLAFLTTDFKKFFFEAPFWQATFLIIFVLSFIWLIHSIVMRPKKRSIEEFIERVKSGGKNEI